MKIKLKVLTSAVSLIFSGLVSAQVVGAPAGTLPFVIPPNSAIPTQVLLDWYYRYGIVPVDPGPLYSIHSNAIRAYQWMSPDVGMAWAQGYKGQGSTVTVLDFGKAQTFTLSGNIGPGQKTQTHGEWVSDFTGAIAPMAEVRFQDITVHGGDRIQLAAKGLNVVNSSLGDIQRVQDYQPTSGSAAMNSAIEYAKKGSAVVVQAAGNFSVDALNGDGKFADQLNRQLLEGTKSAIFVGALNKNGSTDAKASMASYSNLAGSNALMQARFLTVGVDKKYISGIQGTSFAAPIVAGYAAIIGSKFKDATPEAVTQQLLKTARKDTVANYSAAVYGAGEASLSRALAPVSIR